MVKRIFSLGILTIIVSITFSGCLTANEQWAMSPLYRERSETTTDIRGTVAFDRMLLHRRVNPNRILLIERATSGETIQFAFMVDYLGDSWRFIDSLMVRIDDENVITLRETNTVRNVITRKGVNEIVRFSLSDELVERLLNSNSLSVQFAGDFNIIPPEGISALQNFIGRASE